MTKEQVQIEFEAATFMISVIRKKITLISIQNHQRSDKNGMQNTVFKLRIDSITSKIRRTLCL